jgi:hypothetical protein
VSPPAAPTIPPPSPPVHGFGQAPVRRQSLHYYPVPQMATHTIIATAAFDAIDHVLSIDFQYSPVKYTRWVAPIIEGRSVAQLIDIFMMERFSLYANQYYYFADALGYSTNEARIATAVGICNTAIDSLERLARSPG